MADVSVRGLDDRVKERLRMRAAGNGRSMEAEIREILTDAVAEQPPQSLPHALYEAFQALGGVDLDIPPRTDRPRIPDFGE